MIIMLYTYFPCWKLPLCSVDIVFDARILQISWSQICNFFVIVVAYRLVSHPRIHLQIQFCEDFALCFHSKSCIALGLTFRSLRRSELGLRVLLVKDAITFLCTWLYGFISVICWKYCLLPNEWFWHPHQKSFNYICEVLFLVSILFHFSMC